MTRKTKKLLITEDTNIQINQLQRIARERKTSLTLLQLAENHG